jgi:tetraacyldisaccharide 4'-kinase
MSALGAIYGRAARLRRDWYDRHPSARRRLTRPVISVGNLVVGGSGKTPVVAALARLLRAAGMRPAILSRGYARRTHSDGVVVVSDGERVLVGVESSGDEPQMLARALPGVPVLVSPDRYLAGTLAIRQFDAGVLLLDDGFQHLQLERTVDLLLASPADVTEDVLPLGRLREPLGAARSADAVLVHGDAAAAEQLAQTLGVGAAFTVAPTYGKLRPLTAGQPAGNDGPMVAVAGIARPERFFCALREHGHEVVRSVTFRDHHWFTRKDLDRIAAVARAAGATSLVTTEKDAVRLEPLVRAAVSASSPGGQVALPWSVLPVDVEIEPRDHFISWLQARL